MSSIHGIRKAKVFPLPVLAAAKTSLQGRNPNTTARERQSSSSRGGIKEQKLTSPPAGGEWFCAESQSSVQSPTPLRPSECSHSRVQRAKRMKCPQMHLKGQRDVKSEHFEQNLSLRSLLPGAADESPDKDEHTSRCLPPLTPVTRWKTSTGNTWRQNSRTTF